MKNTSFLSFLKNPFSLLLCYIFLSIMCMNFSEPGSLREIRWALLNVINTFDEFQNTFTYRRHLHEENARLKRENFNLNMSNQQLRDVLIENERLVRQLDFKQKKEFDYISARVVGRSTEKGLKTMLLDVGSDDGVVQNMAVVNADGLIGKVITATESNAVVQTLEDHNLFISARLEKSRETGYVAGSGSKLLTLNHVPKNIVVTEGEHVLTSGLSRIYPPGLHIGVVSEIDEQNHAMFKQIKIMPGVNFKAVEEVFLIVVEVGEEQHSE